MYKLKYSVMLCYKLKEPYKAYFYPKKKDVLIMIDEIAGCLKYYYYIINSY